MFSSLLQTQTHIQLTTLLELDVIEQWEGRDDQLIDDSGIPSD